MGGMGTEAATGWGGGGGVFSGVSSHTRPMTAYSTQLLVHC